MKRYPGYKSLIIDVNKESIIKETYGSENLPPAFAPQGGASRRQVAPLACLCGRKKIAKKGEFLPLEKGGGEGFHKSMSSIIMKLLISRQVTRLLILR